IKGGDPLSQTIKENISTSDVFIIILTYAALTSDEVEKEVLQAQKDKKRIEYDIWYNNVTSIKITYLSDSK
ncbi:MAG: hypothetical protein WBL64_01885, partial [Nitrososphaeraceae archaeon]